MKVNDNGDTALHLAARAEKFKACTILIEAKCDVFAKDGAGTRVIDLFDINKLRNTAPKLAELLKRAEENAMDDAYDAAEDDENSSRLRRAEENEHSTAYKRIQDQGS